jgi:hypothetical protein
VVADFCSSTKEESIMATRQTLRVLFGMVAISAWMLGVALPGAAETLNYKFYTWVSKAERVPIGDVEGHAVGLVVRDSFNVLDTGEVATTRSVITNDFLKGTGPFIQYSTITFADGSTIMWRSQGTIGGGAGAYTSEILKGTGRFAGIKGTQSGTAKYLPVEPGGAGAKGYGEGTITYTLPPK